MKNNWQTKKLGEICSIVKGKKPVLCNEQKENMLPYLGAKFLRGTKDAEFAKIDDKGSVLVDENDLIIICDGSKSGDIFSGFKGILSSTMGKMTIDESLVDRNFLRRFLDSNFELFNGSKKGAAIPHLDFYVFKNLEIPLPPLATQQKIVARLDELLGNIAQAKRLRQEAIADTEKILSQTLREIFEEGKGKGWEEKSIEEITKVVTKGTTPKTFGEGFTDNGVPFLKAENILGGPVDLTKLKTFISAKTNDMLNRSKTKPGDVLMTIAGTIGRVGFLPENSPEMNTNQAVAIIRPREDLILPSFLTYALQSPFIQKGIWGGVVAAAIPNFSLTRIKEISMPLPLISEQHQIVTRLDALSAKLRKLRQLQVEQLEDLKKLEKAYLREAFNGELV